MPNKITTMKKSTLGVGILSMVVWHGVNGQTVERPNIVLFLVDDMGWQDTSLPFWNKPTEANKRYHTPHMERLASEGMLFTQAYASAICSPSRVSLMTGMNAARHRVTNWTLRKNQMPVRSHNKVLQAPVWNMNGIGVSKELENAVYVPYPLPKLLKQSGYKTIHVGKAHFGAIGTSAQDPKNIGFDINVSGHACGGLASYLGEENFAGKKPSVWDVPDLEEFHGKEIFLTQALTEKALAAVDSARKESKPFFLYMAHYAVHVPIMGDKRFVQKYLERGLSPIEARYASMIEGVDRSLGTIMNYLEKHDLAANTIILFMSDNGGLSAVQRGGTPHTHNYPLSSGKGSAYEGGIREPMLVKWKGVTKPGSVCNEYIIIEDFYPTLLEMAQVPLEDAKSATVDGESFVYLLKQTRRKGAKKRSLFWHYPNDWGVQGPGISFYSTIRKGKWKLIYYHETERFELFNIDKDIGEKNNLAGAKRRLVKRLARELGHYLKKVKAQMPIRNATSQRVPYPDEIIDRLNKKRFLINCRK